jgi:type IV pilus assembly protein PilY1
MSYLGQQIMNFRTQLRAIALLAGQVAAAVTLLAAAGSANAVNPWQQPPGSTQKTPANLVLALSVEWPTGAQASYTDNYNNNLRYDGYFDNRKCYTYVAGSQWFDPTGSVARGCSGSEWSGNFLNWVAMTNLDQFRSVLTGGSRDASFDRFDLTVLRRSFHDRNQLFPVKSFVAAAGITPSSFAAGTTYFFRSGGYGTKFLVNANNAWPGGNGDEGFIRGNNNTCTQVAERVRGDWQCFNVRVIACKSVAGIDAEANCVPYPRGIKPEGLIQRYNENMRFAAFGYLKADGTARQGGVLRAQMKSVGPRNYNADGTFSSNGAREWDSDGVFLVNPDTADATASGVTSSGVVNYLNLFGYASGYKGNDPVGEMYYAAIRYLRNLQPASDWVSGITTQMLDGSPAIQSYRDPILNTCQKNFVLGIGDIFTHCDSRVPGNQGINASCGGTAPTDPNPAIDMSALWDQIRTMEGLGNTAWTGGAGAKNTYATPFMAGLAWWANTQDIRPDLNGTQNVSTYWVDVLENNNQQSGSTNGIPNSWRVKSQFWMAAKYGGYDSQGGAISNPNTDRRLWDLQNRGVPDTWFPGNSPALLRTSLTRAFEDIARRGAAANIGAPAVSTLRASDNPLTFSVGYDPDQWKGVLRACRLSQTPEQCRAAPVWDATDWFNVSVTARATPKLNNTNRNIITRSSTGNAGNGLEFVWSSLTTTQQQALDGSPSDSLGERRVNYLRGSRADEASLFRVRANTLLGDIVNSSPNILGAPAGAYSGPLFPGFATYRAANSGRPQVIYVGANDGKLHAFRATDGREMFAYVPATLIPNLPDLTNPRYTHRFYVDAGPMIGEVQDSSGNWRPQLVGGLGAGGRGFFSLNLSSQADFATMTQSQFAARVPMWEFTNAEDQDVGFTFNDPVRDPANSRNLQISKLANASNAAGRWAVIVGNGYGSRVTPGSGSIPAVDNSHAVLFMLDPDTGLPITNGKFTVDSSGANGLSTPWPVDLDGDGLIDTIYAGDLKGGMHKFQFSKPSGTSRVLAGRSEAGADWAYIGKIFDTGGQPITSAPIVTAGCNGKIVIAFGSGKLIEEDDMQDVDERGFFAVVDDNSNNTAGWPIRPSSLPVITYTDSLVGGRLIRQPSGSTAPRTNGWRMRLLSGERVIFNPTTPPDTGAVLFSTFIPTTSCGGTGRGFVNGVNVCTGGLGGLVTSDAVGADVPVLGYEVGGGPGRFGGVIASGGIDTGGGGGANTCPQGQVRNAAGDCVPIACRRDVLAGSSAGGVDSIRFQAQCAPAGRYSWTELPPQ